MAEKLNNNVTPSDQIVRNTWQEHDKALGKLPRRLRHFIEFEASVPYSAVHIAANIEMGLDEDTIIRALRRELGDYCREVYGRGHPNAKWEPMKSPHRPPPKTRTRLR